jgi:hypothetical protein
MTGKDSALFPGAKVITDWKVGHPIEFTGEFNGKSFHDYGEITTVEEEKELSFSHWTRTPERPENFHVVQYGLRPEGEKTRVTLSQFNLGPDAEIDDATKAESTKNWKMMLAGLKAATEQSTRKFRTPARGRQG